MRFVGPALLIGDALIVADLHLGLEDRGSLVSKSGSVLASVRALVSSSGARRVVFDGDVLDDFALSRLESRIVIGRLIRSFSREVESVFVKGNHDPMLASLGIEVCDSVLVDGTLVVHGDRALEDVASEADRRSCSRIVIGHEHPAVTISDGIRSERFKCFVLGSTPTVFGDRELVIVPSAHPDLLGSDVDSWRSPIVPADFDGEVVVVGDEPRSFGPLSKL